MEYMHLGDLQMYLSQPLPEAEAMVIVRQVIEAVSYMHENGFVHRDVKAPVRFPLLLPKLLVSRRKSNGLT
jgi:serine/threonine protein kinase